MRYIFQPILFILYLMLGAILSFIVAIVIYLASFPTAWKQIGVVLGKKQKAKTLPKPPEPSEENFSGGFGIYTGKSGRC